MLGLASMKQQVSGLEYLGGKNNIYIHTHRYLCVYREIDIERDIYLSTVCNHKKKKITAGKQISRDRRKKKGKKLFRKTQKIESGHYKQKIWLNANYSFQKE